jgi:hypothetical protein
MSHISPNRDTWLFSCRITAHRCVKRVTRWPRDRVLGCQSIADRPLSKLCGSPVRKHHAMFPHMASMDYCTVNSRCPRSCKAGGQRWVPGDLSDFVTVHTWPLPVQSLQRSLSPRFHGFRPEAHTFLIPVKICIIANLIRYMHTYLLQHQKKARPSDTSLPWPVSTPTTQRTQPFFYALSFAFVLYEYTVGRELIPIVEG